MLFDFVNDIGTYERRKVARFKNESLLISTAFVSDGAKPFETAIADPRYRPEGGFVIVEAYDTSFEAQKGHEKWVKKLTSKTPPKKLVDIANAECAQMLKEFGGGMEYPLQQQD